MNKSLLTNAVLILILFLTNCSKTSTCTCTNPKTGETFSQGSVTSNKKAAIQEFEGACESKVYRVTTGSATYTYGYEVH